MEIHWYLHAISIPFIYNDKQQPQSLLEAVLTLICGHVFCLNSSSYSKCPSKGWTGRLSHALPSHLVLWCWNNYSSRCQTIHLCSLAEDRKEDGRIR